MIFNRIIKHIFLHSRHVSYNDTKLIDLRDVMLVNATSDRESAATSKSKVLFVTQTVSILYHNVFLGYSKALVNNAVVA